MAFGGETTWGINWLNANSQRRYPLSEDATLVDTSSSFTLPNDLIVDMIIPVHADPSVDPTLFHLAAVTVFGTGVTIALGYDGTIIGSIAVDTVSFVPNSTFTISCSGAFFDTVGKIVVGSLDATLQSAGAFSFDLAGGRLVPTVIKPDIRGVNAIYLQNGQNISTALQDDVVLQAGRNIVLNIVTTPGEPDRLVINAVDGAGLNQGCDCDENATLPCINTINGVAPDTGGNFTLLGDDCLLLDSIANGLQLTDQCSKPCCGCTELDIVRQAMEFMVTEVNSLENLAARLEQAMQTMETNLLSSKTNNLS
jgi:hypothetical protein